MSAREWKPGDVAMRRGINGEEGRTVLTHSFGCRDKHTRRPHWHHADGGWDSVEDGLSHYRPLVVIDPEDGEAVERLLYLARNNDSIGTESMRDALREFANPKPREVYRHFVESDSGDGQLASKCGKVWRPDPTVSVIADCPECTALVRDGWSA